MKRAAPQPPQPPQRAQGAQTGTPEEEGARKQARPAGVDVEFAAIQCPYLDTIDRKVLDFDFEKLCSVSLSNLNVYACLVCGRYYQGRSRNSHAYFHSLESDHHVFINLETERIYCLPDGYQVRDPSLEDIVYNLHPTFSPQQVVRLDSRREYARAVDGSEYLPGLMGLNNIKNTDWLNVSVQALVRVPPLRDFFIQERNYEGCPSVLVHKFGELVRKVWSERSFKGQHSPHELLQAISSASNKRFRIGNGADPLQFLSWFLNTMHRELRKIPGNKKRSDTVITRTFQGSVRLTERKPVVIGEAAIKTAHEAQVEDERRRASQQQRLQGDEGDMEEDGKFRLSVRDVPFLYLSLDLPAAPLFKDTQDRGFIPQIPLFDVLRRFDEEQHVEEVLDDGTRRKHCIARLPPFLIIHLRRFKTNNWFVEKNPTLVTFPLRNLEMRPYLCHQVAERQRESAHHVPSHEHIQAMGVAQLKELLARLSQGADKGEHCVEKSELVDRCESWRTEYEGRMARLDTRYDLLANICHEGTPQEGSYKVHIHHRGRDTWYEVQDLRVHTSETMPQLVAVSEAYIQVYELSKPAANHS